MSNALFPTPPGLHWEIEFEDEFRNINQPATAPGWDTRVSLGPDPLFHIKLSFNWLRQPGTPHPALYHDATDELAMFRDFFRARQGDFDSFLLDPSALTGNDADDSVEGQPLTADSAGVAPIAVGDPASYLLNIYEVQGPPQLYMSGGPMVLGTDYTIEGPGVIGANGISYPGLAAVITRAIAGPVTADISWYYRVKFSQDTQKYQRFLALLYSAQEIQLETTRT